MTSFFKYLLYPFTILYGSVVWLRNRLYDTGFMSAVSFDLPVIAVGNLSVGGTGKTPHVEYLVRLLQYEYRVATMSRGYKRRTRGFLLADGQSNALQIGDEPMQYHLKFPELVVSVAEERMTGIPSLLQHRPDVDLVILDDAYQHRSVKAGLNILITDYSRPFYNDHILPYGALRESRSAAARADVIIVSKCPAALSPEQAADIRSHIKALPHQQVFFSTIRYAPTYDFFNQIPVDLKHRKVLLVSGIARPEPLLAHVQQMSAEVHLLSYPDHHFFTHRNLEEMRSARENWGDDAVIVTTEKDATRLHLYRKQLEEWQIPLIVLPITVDILLDAKDEFNNMIRSYVRSAGPELEYENPVID